MKIKVQKDVFKKIPKLKVGVLVFTGIDNFSKKKEIDKMLNTIENYARATYVDEKLSEVLLLQNWHRVFKIKRSFKTAIEPMISAILKGKEVPRRNSIVDICNFIMLKHMIPIGTDDLDKIEGDIKVKFSKGTEVFKAGRKAESPIRGEIIYTDNKEVLSRRFSWKEAEKTKVSYGTKNVLVYLDAIPPIEKDDLKRIMDEIIELVTVFCGGKAKSFILSEKKPEKNIL
ncbi:hypothetical protein KY330_05665 [Candidatus Woesearchaeota archaeon]|nr:hypothetical protein [Candidatus Woesearchaeota archaeon]